MTLTLMITLSIITIAVHVGQDMDIHYNENAIAGKSGFSIILHTSTGLECLKPKNNGDTSSKDK